MTQSLQNSRNEKTNLYIYYSRYGRYALDSGLYRISLNNFSQLFASLYVNETRELHYVFFLNFSAICNRAMLH